MRERIYLRVVTMMALVLTLGVMAAAQDVINAPEQLVSPGPSPATITISNDGLSIDPARPGPGSVSFTIINNSNRARGVVISGEDRAGTPIIRFSEMIPPGGRGQTEFFFFLGNQYTLRDYVSRQVVGGESMFNSMFTMTLVYPAPAGLGRGPSFPRQDVSVTLTNTGMQMGEISGGPTTFMITNNSSRPRGLVITGEDRAGSPIIRYSRLIPPRDSARLEFWMFGNRSFTFRDYTSRRIVGDEVAFRSTYSQTVSVPAIPLPPRFEASTLESETLVP